MRNGRLLAGLALLVAGKTLGPALCRMSCGAGSTIATALTSSDSGQN